MKPKHESFDVGFMLLKMLAIIGAGLASGTILAVYGPKGW